MHRKIDWPNVAMYALICVLLAAFWWLVAVGIPALIVRGLGA